MCIWLANLHANRLHIMYVTEFGGVKKVPITLSLREKIEILEAAINVCDRRYPPGGLVSTVDVLQHTYSYNEHLSVKSLIQRGKLCSPKFCMT